MSDGQGSVPTSEEDARLVEGARGDPAAFAPLYERYATRVYAFCYRRVGTVQEAEDLTSQVFVQAIANLHTFKGGVFAAWLFTIARNTVAMHHRKQRSHVRIDDLALASPEDKDDQRDLLRDLISELPEEKQTLIALMLDAQLTSADVGEILGKSAGAVRTEFYRLLLSLREQVRKEIL